MPPALRNVLAVVAGWVAGSVVNLGLVEAGSAVFPLAGVDPDDLATLAAALEGAGPEHFLFPWLAHALGTLAGAALAARLAATRPMALALTVGVIFLLGGVAVNFMLPGPTWFKALDLLLAYLPMAYLGGLWGRTSTTKSL